MNICYFVNQYPKVSHTFIKREILALESLGANITRVTVREAAETLVDQTDIEEKQRTQVLLAQSKGQLLSNAFKTVLKAPIPALKAFGQALKLGFYDEFRIAHNLFYFIEACALLTICEQNQIRHVHAHFGTNSTSVAMLCRYLGGPSYSFTVHGPEEFDKIGPLSLSQKIEQSAFVAAITSFCRAQLYRWCSFSAWHKIKEIHCSIDGELTGKALTPIKQSHRFISIGRFCEQKGQMLLLQALAQVKQKGLNFHLDLIGDGEMRSDIEAFIRKEQLQENIHLLGWQSTSQIIDSFEKSSALLLPSFAEGLPVVIMEAYARARPVLSTYIAGIPELVSEDSGWLIPAGNVEALAATIEEIIATPLEQLNKLGQRGHQKVLERHDSIIEAKKILEHIKALSS
ncbi:MAG: colanic acid biosynthesis glycosyltransferase WcaL [Alteromonadaceae bacterium]|nr:MAG: colanic acid biosynthesis glycosyltransferase WcaL [Alteromonadaceae bacterium]